ncbi:hypothetical protein CFB39_35545 [Burkholderia sp. AU6039]|nr:hypothetical protein CFB39_35545 [Burkholderia sp. AU6039]
MPRQFSDSAPTPALLLKFLHGFADDIMRPVARDEQVHIDYLTSAQFARDLRHATSSSKTTD